MLDDSRFPLNTYPKITILHTAPETFWPHFFPRLSSIFQTSVRHAPFCPNLVGVLHTLGSSSFSWPSIVLAFVYLVHPRTWRLELAAALSSAGLLETPSIWPQASWRTFWLATCSVGKYLQLATVWLHYCAILLIRAFFTVSFNLCHFFSAFRSYKVLLDSVLHLNIHSFWFHSFGANFLFFSSTFCLICFFPVPFALICSCVVFPSPQWVIPNPGFSEGYDFTQDFGSCFCLAFVWMPTCNDSRLSKASCFFGGLLWL